MMTEPQPARRMEELDERDLEQVVAGKDNLRHAASQFNPLNWPRIYNPFNPDNWGHGDPDGPDYH